VFGLSVAKVYSEEARYKSCESEELENEHMFSFGEG
jgi:hypothetical protein